MSQTFVPLLKLEYDGLSRTVLSFRPRFIETFVVTGSPKFKLCNKDILVRHVVVSRQDTPVAGLRRFDQGILLLYSQTTSLSLNPG